MGNEKFNGLQDSFLLVDPAIKLGTGIQSYPRSILETRFTFQSCLQALRDLERMAL